MGRSLNGRVRQYELQQPAAQRKRRSDQLTVEDSLTRTHECDDHYKKARSENSSASRLEWCASNARVAQVNQTAVRNVLNQQIKQASERLETDEANFFSEIDAPLSKVCGVCGELVPPKSVRAVPYSATDARFRLLGVDVNGHQERGLIEAGVWRVDSTEYVAFCARCDRAIQSGVVPRFSIASGFKLCSVPHCLAVLNPMEARMVGLGICFTTCYTLGSLGQTATRGNSINFWNDDIDLVAKLPRPPQLCGVIQLRRHEGRGSCFTVRPWLLRKALDWLRANNPLYRGVVVDETVMDSLDSHVLP
jgi:hypothetical protein